MTGLRCLFALILFGVFCFGIPSGAALVQDTVSLPLAEIGPYDMIGGQKFAFFDETRGRSVEGFIWYPAGQTSGTRRPGPLIPKTDAAPDSSAAPYPLIFYSHPAASDPGITAKTTLGIAEQLVSYGFIVVSIEHHDPRVYFTNLAHRPMDILFVLDQLAATSDENEWAGLIDFEHVGVTGYSLGGMTALLFSGAQIDLMAHEEYCATVAQLGNYDCDRAHIEALLAERAQYQPPLAEGEPWPAYTDDRIVAVMPIAPCRGPLWGERGLANATIPTLIVGLERDEKCTYERDALYMYEHLGSADRSLLTVFKQGHDNAVLNRDPQKIFRHFAVAFFGYHLQGKTEYAQYLTAEFVKGFDNLAWASTTE